MVQKPKALIAWSSGKDSAWALHEARREGAYDIVGALTTVTDTFERVSMHGVREELLRALGTRFAEEIILGCILDDFAAVHENDALCDFAGESHFMGDAHHGHAFMGEFHHDIQHLIDHLRVERRGGFVE